MTDTILNLNENKPGNTSQKIQALECLWPFLQFYRIFGLVPISRAGNSINFKYLSPSWVTGLGGVLSSVIIIKILLNNLFYKSSAVMSTLRDLLFIGHPLLNILAMVYCSRFLPWFFKSCQHFEEQNLTKYLTLKDMSDIEDKKLPKKCYILLGIIGLCLLCDSTLFYISAWIDTGSTNLKDFLSIYSTFYDLDSNFLTGLFLCCAEIYSFICWFQPDVFLCIISIIFTNYMAIFNGALRTRIGQLDGMISTDDLEKIRCDYREIIKLIQNFTKHFSVLFVLAYCGNSAYLFVKLYIGISTNFVPEKHWTLKLCVAFNLCLVLLKIFLPTYLSAKINDESKVTLALVQDLPTGHLQKPEPTRLLLIDHFTRQLTMEEIGISCNGFFTITKSFLVALISGFITYEIVVLEFTK